MNPFEHMPIRRSYNQSGITIVCLIIFALVCYGAWRYIRPEPPSPPTPSTAAPQVDLPGEPGPQTYPREELAQRVPGAPKNLPDLLKHLQDKRKDANSTFEKWFCDLNEDHGQPKSILENKPERDILELLYCLQLRNYVHARRNDKGYGEKIEHLTRRIKNLLGTRTQLHEGTNSPYMFPTASKKYNASYEVWLALAAEAYIQPDDVMVAHQGQQLNYLRQFLHSVVSGWEPTVHAGERRLDGSTAGTALYSVLVSHFQGEEPISEDELQWREEILTQIRGALEKHLGATKDPALSFPYSSPESWHPRLAGVDVLYRIAGIPLEVPGVEVDWIARCKELNKICEHAIEVNKRFANGLGTSEPENNVYYILYLSRSVGVLLRHYGILIANGPRISDEAREGYCQGVSGCLKAYDFLKQGIQRVEKNTRMFSLPNKDAISSYYPALVILDMELAISFCDSALSRTMHTRR